MTWRTPAPPGPRPPPKRGGWQWSRLETDFLDRPIWRAVAKKARAPLAQVLCVVLRLECLANKSIPRGSVADMSVTEFAAALQLRPDVVARIRGALEEPDIAWIDTDQEVIVDYCLRNPDMADPTAADRQRRRRAKLRAARQQNSADAHPDAATRPSVVHSPVTRDTVTVGPDHGTRAPDPVPGCGQVSAGAAEPAEKVLQIQMGGVATGPPLVHSPVTRDTVTASRQIRSDLDPGQGCGKPEGEPDAAAPRSGLSEGQRGAPVPTSPDRGEVDAARESARAWLAIAGRAIVEQRLQEPTSRAQTRIDRWLRDLDGDPVALVEIIQANEGPNLLGARWHNLVSDAISRRRRAVQPALPLPPVPAAPKVRHGTG